MIAILTESIREANLLAALFDQRSWPCQTCGTMSGFAKLAEKTSPRAIVIRHRLGDGYSDDVFAWLKSTGRLPRTRTIVLVSADCSIRQEARQVALGADCVLRDPLRIEVLLEYLAKYRAGKEPTISAEMPQQGYEFADTQIRPHEHHLVRANKTVQAAPQVIALLRLLYHGAGKVIPYPVMYSELFNQKFTGDTANCRVLLAKAVASFSHLDIDLRDYIKVIPKSGYLYTPKPVISRHRKRS
jgi:DNA-binding response OmpR family regulator